LLGCDIVFDIDHYTPSLIQRLKKSLVRELELEDGRINSLGGHVLDKSSALELSDDLLDSSKRKFHWIIFQDRRLCDFLHKGDITLFTYDESYSPARTLDALDDSVFLKWISTPFYKQYDLVLSRALDSGDLVKMRALLSGPRYVAEQDDDLCFSGARRIIDRRMERLRAVEAYAGVNLPSLNDLSKMLMHPQDRVALAPLLNLLPVAHFRSFQDEAVRLIRSIAVECNNRHSDPDLAKGILQLAKSLASVSADIKHQIEMDEQQVNEIAAKEREHEFRRTQGGAPLVSLVSRWVGTSPGSIEITREGVRKDVAFIAAKDLKAIRWGITITQGCLYDFFLSVQSGQGAEIQISWCSVKDLEKESFSKMIDASLSYALPSIINKINANLDNNKSVIIGNCELNRSHLVILSWFGTKRNEVPWSRVHSEVARGDVIISDRANSKIRVTMPMRTTYNAITIGIIAASRGQQQ
jgi:hypothetical protein